MKPSHRKDVIIARVIFACICLALLAGIVAIVIMVSSHNKRENSKPEDNKTVVESQTEEKEQTQQESENVINRDEIVTEQTEIELPKEVKVKTTTGVNLRSEPDKEAGILTLVPEDTQLVVIEEDNGWVEVTYDGHTGYIYTEFVKEMAQ